MALYGNPLSYYGEAIYGANIYSYDLSNLTIAGESSSVSVGTLLTNTSGGNGLPYTINGAATGSLFGTSSGSNGTPYTESI